MLFSDELNKIFNMRRATVAVYVKTVGLVTDNVELRSERTENGASYRPGSAVSAVKTDAKLFIRI